jgi:signal transduction histidine kinase
MSHSAGPGSRRGASGTTSRPGYTASARPTREQRSRLAQAAEQAARRWPLSRITSVAILAMTLFSLLAIAIAGTALASLSSARARVVNVIDPAAQAGQKLAYDIVNQETGVRGYLLSGKREFLGPYYAGLAGQNEQVRVLTRLTAGLPHIGADLAQVQARVDAWRRGYATSAIRQVRAAGKPVVSPQVFRGKMLFDLIRTPLSNMENALSNDRTQASRSLNDSATTLDAVALGLGVALLLVVGGVALGLRATAIRPLMRLASQARRVAAGDFEYEVTPEGPREAADLAVDVNRMRVRILDELSSVRQANLTLEARAHELERSNSELEQFAYVASHDLQEPLRKVASFCQLLQRRYVGQLDQRADQYIEYAVDGAKRMQVLIDDLLAFSRVGRVQREPVLISCASALSAARVNLAAEIRASRAVIEAADLPTVRAEFSLITSLFQNLVGNAIKFRGEEPPRVVISAERREDFWKFCVADNGIGIEPEYADRIFVIFQRLHDRASYPGTGIGLAMCRKIVEYYGGRIWLETTAGPGATFCFTLPVPFDDEE